MDLKTANDFLNENDLKGKLYFHNSELEERDRDDIIDIMIEFAKLHVRKALQEVQKRIYMSDDSINYMFLADRNSILNTYDLNNIK